ncbi:aminoglycoside phosphotransferase [Actinopolyspora mortivallis]|uniref:Aminoglycoside phosphotransferase n=1 Tax=Actinopolyspora mortivallis TaxID=33906 RepID=A0A2T0GV10_ACTMO|nr:aminoglycoside phosphotransferase [Actinopolyspora mortivallis]PRW62956.1 aminoglycoside phosphotransferase [Actinopolyspora mortivallis]
MSPSDSEVAEADLRFAAWMRENLDHAAEHFGVTITGEPVHGWRLLSIGAPARSGQGRRWLRVVTEQPPWARGAWWVGNAEANVITGLRKPHVLDTHEWEIPGVRRQRAELMTYLSGRACAAENVLRQELDLPESWWHRLRGSLDTLADFPTDRRHKTEPEITGRLNRIGARRPVLDWETVHGDLHWANLLQPELGLLDWSLWGRGPAGTDAATLYCYSLLAPRTAATVWHTFVDILDAPSGTTALLHVAARLLRRVESGDHPELAPPLHQLVERLTQR